MSGGLEVAAGVIAVVQVTGQAVVLTLKIKQLWAEVRNAPQEVQDLLDEIELTSLLLQDIERQTEQRGMPVGLASASIMQHTQRAHQALESTADLLDAELKRSPSRVRIMMASTKVLLKKSMLDQLKEKMDRSLRLLQMSLQVQTVMLVARASSITLDPLPNAPSESLPAITSADGNTLDDEAAEDISEQSQVTNSNIVSKGCLYGFDPQQVHQWSWAGRFNFSFSSGDEGWVSIQPPSWLTRSTHVLITKRAIGGPQLALRRYEVIKGWDAQVLNALQRDDWPSLERNLRTTRISPFATSVHGSDLVIFACIFKSIEILKRLLDIGLEARVDSSDDDDDSDFFRVKIGSTYRRLSSWQSIIFNGLAGGDWRLSCEIQRIALSHVLDSISNNFNSLLLVLEYIPVTALQQYLDLYMPDRQSFSLQQRIRIACSLLHSDFHNDIGVVLPELKDSSAMSEEPSGIRGSYLIHHLALDIGRLNHLEQQSNSSRHVEKRLQWLTRCAQADPQGPYRIALAEDFLYSSYRWAFLSLQRLYVTPLIAFLLSWRFIYSHNTLLHRIHPFQLAFHSFLLSLQDAGVDLAALGRNERRLHLESFRAPNFGETRFSNWDPTEHLSNSRFRAFGISFGCRVDDWVIWCAWEYEHFAMEFWNMVENPQCHPPGSWVDDKSKWTSEWESFQDYCALNDETSFVWSEVEEGKAGR